MTGTKASPGFPLIAIAALVGCGRVTSENLDVMIKQHQALKAEVESLSETRAQLQAEVSSLRNELQKEQPTADEKVLKRIFPGIFRFPGLGVVIKMDHAVVEEISLVWGNASKHTVRLRTKYNNRSSREYSPDLTLYLYDKNGVPLPPVSDHWAFDTVNPGEVRIYETNTGVGPKEGAEMREQLFYARLTDGGKVVNVRE